MKPLFWSICLVFCASALRAQTCYNYDCVILKVKKLLLQPQKDYKYILNNLNSAEGYLDGNSTDKRKVIQALRDKVFVAIENEKNIAQNARIAAQAAEEKARKAQAQTELALKQVEIEKQTAIAEKNKAQAAEASAENEKQIAFAEKNKAQAAEKKANDVLDKIYFYDGKFGLAYDKSNKRYGFIDKNLNKKIEFKYLEANAFDYDGFAKVKKRTYNYMNSEPEDIIYLIDTLGREYKLATDIQQLDSSITALDLRNRDLYTIHPSILKHRQLKVLSLIGNNIKNLPNDIVKMDSLQHLRLNGNQITSLPIAFGKLTNLQTLNLSYNRLTSLPVEFGNLINLQNLDLSENKWISLAAEVGKLTNLRNLNLGYLNLSHTQLTNLILAFNKLTNLQELRLNNNQLASLPLEFGKLDQLQYLDLSSNKLTSLPAEFGRLTNLQNLDLSENKLTSLPAEFGRLTNLQNLDLSENKLTNLPTELGNLKSIDVRKYLAHTCNSIAWEQLGVDKFSEAEQNIRFGMRLDSNNLDLPVNLILTLWAQDKYEVAKKEYIELKNSKVKKHVVNTCNDIAWGQLGADLFSQAEQNIRFWMRLDSNNLDLSATWIFALWMQGKSDAAEKEYIGLKNIEVKTKAANACNRIARELLETGKFSKAEQIVRFGMRFDSTNLDLPATLTLALLRQGKYEAAEKEYIGLKSIDEKKEAAKTCNSIAWEQLKTGKFSKAEQVIRFGMRLDSNNLYLPSNLPLSLLLQGKYEAAQKEYIKLKNKPFALERNLPFYKDAFLQDLKEFEGESKIPKERQPDVEKIKALLQKE